MEPKALITALVTIPGRWRERLRYDCAVGSRLMPQPTYGFSRGFRSTARPYACFDQCPVLRPPVQGDGTASRHSNEPVTSPSFGCWLRGPYMLLIDMWRIGKWS